MLLPVLILLENRPYLPYKCICKRNLEKSKTLAGRINKLKLEVTLAINKEVKNDRYSRLNPSTGYALDLDE